MLWNEGSGASSFFCRTAEFGLEEKGGGGVYAGCSTIAKRRSRSETQDVSQLLFFHLLWIRTDT